MTPADEPDRRAGNEATVGPRDRPGETVLHVLAQRTVGGELRDLRSAGAPLCVPLGGRRSIEHLAAAGRRVAPAAHARSSKASDPRGGRSRARRAAVHAGWRSPRVRQTTGGVPRAGRARVASRQRDGTIGTRLLLRPLPRPPHPRSRCLERRRPRSERGLGAARPMACLANTSGRAMPESPTPACRRPSPSTSVLRCCDDSLSPPGIACALVAAGLVLLYREVPIRAEAGVAVPAGGALAEGSSVQVSMSADEG